MAMKMNGADLACTYDNIFHAVGHAGDWDWTCNDSGLVMNCGDLESFINFFKLYFCVFKGGLYYLVPTLVLLIFLIFRFICALVDEFIAPAIMYI